ncbi:MAG: SpaA isopeptide-forming pilin-related protein [Coriobacteriia bacterium]|nr:SpaA isopeptide-forming pilin-related protein [Coriobacteriia bacterium]
MNIYLDETSISVPAYSVSLDEVTDKLGDHISFGGFVNVDGQADCADDVITWTPSAKPGLRPTYQAKPVQGWLENASELAYKVTLDTSAPDFKSCADNMDSKVGDEQSHRVNKSASLSYHRSPIEGAPSPDGSKYIATFPVPYVRGLLYSLELKKVDASTDDPLPGAVFGLIDESGDEVVNAQGDPIRAASAQDGIAKFRGLAYGTYSVVELEAPTGYQAGDDGIPSVTLCYTDGRASLAKDHESGHASDRAGDSAYMLPSTSAPAIPNKRNLGLRVLKRDGDTQDALEGVLFGLYADDGDGRYTKDDPRAKAYSDKGCTKRITGDVPTDASGRLHFFGLTPGTYWLAEARTVAGYQRLDEPVRLAITRDYRVLVHESLIEAVPDADKIAQVTVDNYKVEPLPRAGSSARFSLGIAGAALTGLGLLILLLGATERRGRRGTVG